MATAPGELLPRLVQKDQVTNFTVILHTALMSSSPFRKHGFVSVRYRQEYTSTSSELKRDLGTPDHQSDVLVITLIELPLNS